MPLSQPSSAVAGDAVTALITVGDFVADPPHRRPPHEPGIEESTCSLEEAKQFGADVVANNGREDPLEAVGSEIITQERPKGVGLAQAACVVGVVFAVVSAYWGVGGTWLLNTLGGSIERQARAGGASAVVVLLTVAVVKLVAAVLPLLALRRLTRPAWNRSAWVLAWTEAAVLIVYGVLYTGVGLLVQAGAIDVPVTANRRAFAWHAYLWDPWFLVWGLLVAGALLRGGHDRKPTLNKERN